jgi:hypothetical protein
MLSNERRAAWAGVVALLLPTLAVILFSLLQSRLDTPTAGGISALAAIALAFFFFPRLRIRAGRLVLAVSLALAVAAFVALLL